MCDCAELCTQNVDFSFHLSSFIGKLRPREHHMRPREHHIILVKMKDGLLPSLDLKISALFVNDLHVLYIQRTLKETYL